MSRRPPHFKTFVSIQNHGEMNGVYDDDALLAMYSRAGMMGIERYADKTGDSFLLSTLDICRIANVSSCGPATQKLRRLCNAATSPLRLSKEGARWRLTIPNFAKKQFNREVNGTETVASSSSTSTSPSTYKKEGVSGLKNGGRIKKPRKKAEVSEAAPELLRRFLLYMQRTHPTVRGTGATLQPWLREFDLMIRVDKRELAQVLNAIHWLEAENPRREASFVVQSAKGLREKFDRIVVAMERQSTEGRRHDTANRGESSLRRAARKLLEQGGPGAADPDPYPPLRALPKGE